MFQIEERKPTAILAFGRTLDQKVLHRLVVDRYAPLEQSFHTCPGAPHCMYRCPLKMEDIPQPLGEPCPMESAQAEMWFNDLARELGVDEDAASEIAMLREVVKLQIQMQRMEAVMARSSPEVRVVNAFNPFTGEAYEAPKEHHLFKTYKNTTQRLEALRKELVATRKEKLKAQRVTDPAASMARFLEMIRKMQASPLAGELPSQVLDLVQRNTEDQDLKAQRVAARIEDGEFAVQPEA